MTTAYTWKHAKGEDREGSVRRLLREALEKGLVDAVLVPAEGPSGAGIVNMFTTDPEELGAARPFARAMAQFGPQDLVRLTEPGGGPVKVAAVLKPCECRAVVELAKLKQIDLANVTLVSPDCEGTVELKDYREAAEGKALPVRLACKICRARVPGEPVDLGIGTLGVGADHVLLEAKTERGQALAEGLGAHATEHTEHRKSAVKKAIEDGEAAYDAQEKLSREKYAELNALLSELGTCIKCMNCQNVCPVCYCKECLLYTDAFNPTAGSLADKARRRGTLRMPVETVQFHMTRMAHVMAACVMCGQCQSACPSQIPLVEIYAGINRRIQDLFDYQAGRSLDEAPPFTCFSEHENFEAGKA